MTNILSSDQHDPVAHRTTLGRITSLVGALAPILIIGGLLYSAFFVKPEFKGVSVQPPVIEKRDVFYGVAVPTPDTVLAAGNFGKVIRSNDGGKNWSLQVTNVTTHLQSIAAWNPERAVAVGNAGTIIVTSDGGKTWAKASIPEKVTGAKLLRVRVYPEGKAWAGGEMSTALYSSDFGATWRTTTPVEDIAWNDIAFVNDVGWLVGEFGRMQVTRDGGASWRAMGGPVKSSLNAVYFRNEKNGIVVGTEGVMLQTQDGGANWLVLPKVVEYHLFDALWDGNQWVVVGGKGSLLTASDSGDKWHNRAGVARATWHTQIAGGGNRYMLAGYGVEAIDINQGKNNKTEQAK